LSCEGGGKVFRIIEIRTRRDGGMVNGLLIKCKWDVNGEEDFCGLRKKVQGVSAKTSSDFYDVNTIANYYPAIIQYLDQPIGSQLERIPDTNKYRLVNE